MTASLSAIEQCRCQVRARLTKSLVMAGLASQLQDAHTRLRSLTMDTPFTRRPRGHSRPLALVLGTNEMASAVGIELHREGYGVVLSHDPSLPVIRRGMAFHDALFGDEAEVDGYSAVCAERAIDAKREASTEGKIAVTPLELCDLLVIGDVSVLVDARMLKR